MNEEPISLEAKRNEPDEEIVRILREWLTLAKSGELRSLCIVGDVIYDGKADFVRYGVVCEDLLHAASMSEQHAFHIRHDITAANQTAAEIEPDEEGNE